MAQGKKTFIFYSDWNNMIREMPNEDAGALLKHVMAYVNDENPTTENILVKMAFGHMKPLLKNDLDKWDSIREKRKKAGKKGGQANAKQNEANAKQVEAVNVNVNVNDNVNDNVNVNDSLKKEYSQKVLQTFEACLKYFPDHLHPDNKKKIDSWLDTIDKLNRIEKVPFENILDIIKKTREDDFWAQNFLSVTKLRKNNKDGIKYVVVFNEKIKSNAKNQSSNSGKRKEGTTEEELAEILADHFDKQRRGIGD